MKSDYSLPPQVFDFSLSDFNDTSVVEIVEDVAVPFSKLRKDVGKIDLGEVIKESRSADEASAIIFTKVAAQAIIDQFKDQANSKHPRPANPAHAKINDIIRTEIGNQSSALVDLVASSKEFQELKKPYLQQVAAQALIDQFKDQANSKHPRPIDPTHAKINDIIRTGINNQSSALVDLVASSKEFQELMEPYLQQVAAQALIDQFKDQANSKHPPPSDPTHAKINDIIRTGIDNQSSALVDLVASSKEFQELMKPYLQQAESFIPFFIVKTLAFERQNTEILFGKSKSYLFSKSDNQLMDFYKKANKDGDENVLHRMARLVKAPATKDLTVLRYKDYLLQTLSDLKTEQDPTRKKFLIYSINIYLDILEKAIEAAQKRARTNRTNIADEKKLDDFIYSKLGKIDNYLKRITEPQYQSLFLRHQVALDSYDKDLAYVSGITSNLKPMLSYHAFVAKFISEKETGSVLDLANPEQIKKDRVHYRLRYTEEEIHKAIPTIESVIEDINTEKAKLQTISSVLKKIDDHIQSLPSFLFKDKKATLRSLQATLRQAYKENSNQSVSEIVNTWRKEQEPAAWNINIATSKFLFFAAKEDKATMKLINDLLKDDRKLSSAASEQKTEQVNTTKP